MQKKTNAGSGSPTEIERIIRLPPLNKKYQQKQYYTKNSHQKMAIFWAFRGCMVNIFVSFLLAKPI